MPQIPQHTDIFKVVGVKVIVWCTPAVMPRIYQILNKYLLTGLECA